MALLLGENLQLAEGTHIWKEIGDIILGVQPKLKVDNRGDPVNGNKPTVDFGNEESFAMLHFYHNCCAHRDLVRFNRETRYMKINCRTSEMCIVEEREEQEGYTYKALTKGSYVMLPEVITRRKDSKGNCRLLLVVLEQLMSFVTDISSKLIHASLLLPSATSILQSHVRGYRMPHTKFTTTEEGHRATVTLTPECGGMVVKLSSADRSSKVDAKEAYPARTGQTKNLSRTPICIF